MYISCLSLWHEISRPTPFHLNKTISVIISNTLILSTLINWLRSSKYSGLRKLFLPRVSRLLTCWQFSGALTKVRTKESAKTVGTSASLLTRERCTRNFSGLCLSTSPRISFTALRRETYRFPVWKTEHHAAPFYRSAAARILLFPSRPLAVSLLSPPTSSSLRSIAYPSLPLLFLAVFPPLS